MNTLQSSRLADRIAAWIFGTIASLTVLLLIGIFAFLCISGIGAFTDISLTDFLFGTRWNPEAMKGALWGTMGLATGTIFVCIGSLVFAVPLGLALAIYLSQLAAPNMREILKPVIEMISGIPSVVLGLLGLLYIAPLVANTFNLSNGLTALTASLLVGLATVPTIASICEDALSSVSRQLSEASLAVGATQWTTIRRVIIPAASSGIATAIMLGLGRAIGETMIVLMVAGNSLAFPHSLFSPVRPMTATIAIEIREVVVGDLHWKALFAMGLVLFVVTFIINTACDLLFPSQRLRS
jgi:phosphate transport system permease protein